MINIRNIKRPLILLTFVGQCLAQGIILPVVQLPLYLASLALLSLITLFTWFQKTNAKINKREKFATRSIVLVFCICVSFALNGNFSSDRILLISTSFCFCLACYDEVQDLNDVKWLINTFIITAFVSAIVEIGQFFNVDFCFSMWRMTHQGERILTSIAADRFMGLSPTILHFAYFISAAFILTLFHEFKKFNFVKKTVLLGVFTFALFTNNTRSSIVLVLVATIIRLFIVDKTSTKSNFVQKSIISIMLIIGTWYVFNKTDIYLSSRFNSDEGFDLRISMFLTAFNHLRHFPFGMGNYAAMPQYIITIGNASASYIQEVGAHNLIANCAASYGLVGLLVFLDLYLVIICEFFQNKRKSFQYIGIFLGIVSLALNACVHNLYMLSGDLMSFLLIGLLLGTENGYRES